MRATFAAIVSTACQIAGQTAAEFDYALSRGPVLGQGAYDAFDMAISVLVNGDSERREEVRVAQADSFAAMVEAAKAKAYTGWSDASREPIRYAR